MQKTNYSHDVGFIELHKLAYKLLVINKKNKYIFHNHYKIRDIGHFDIV